MKEKTMVVDQWGLLRILVLPMLFIAAVVKHPAAQWIALAALGLWSSAQVVLVIIGKVKEVKEKTETKKQNEEMSGVEEKLSPTELFLIRQTNQRITEKLKGSYPSAAWLWTKRPEAEELVTGGTWRIQLTNTDPYNMGEVSIAPNGSMDILLILASPLNQAETGALHEEENADLQKEDELDRTDALTWYTEYGGDTLAGMIDDLNTQGHKKLTISEDGEVLITANGKEIAVDQLEWFLPRVAWSEFITLLKEDGIKASEEATGLVLTW